MLAICFKFQPEGLAKGSTVEKQMSSYIIDLSRLAAPSCSVKYLGEGVLPMTIDEQPFPLLSFHFMQGRHL